MCNNKLTKPYYEALPATLKPLHYDISILDIDEYKEVFKGKVTIQLEIVEETNELHLNYRDLVVSQDKIHAFVVNDQRKPLKIVSLEENKKKEYFIIRFDENLVPKSDSKLEITIDYNAIVQTNMMGFYKSVYQENGAKKIMLSTQFEATDARRAFPCLDEPALKATFSVDITLRSDWDVLSNMPVSQTENLGANEKKVTFQKTPLMPTYLLAWACGELEYIETFTDDKYYDGKPLPIRIYTTKGYSQDAQLALEIAPKIIDYFSKVFEIKYPLPKLDMIAVPTYSHNGMENWGLITYRTTALLYSETKSDPSYKQNVVYVVAHELAHQWFGDLVTMKWWDELWLNEGFATWVGYAAEDYLFPEWDVFSSFVSESLQSALDLDGLRNSHPIEIPVVDALDIDQVFDHISYLKGSSTIMMISTYLGRDTFLKGVAKYLNKNKFGNATSDDLWSAIEEVSGKPVGKLMSHWIKKIGFPVLDVENTNSGRLTITQSRFLNGGDATEEENQTKWWVPLNVSGDSEIRDSFPNSLEQEKLVVESFPNGQNFFKLNKDSCGVYRVNYYAEVLQNNILPFFGKLSARDKVGLIADMAVLAISGKSNTVIFLDMVKSITENDQLQDNCVVWAEISKRLKKLMIVFSEDEQICHCLNKFYISIYKKKALEILSSNDDSSDFLHNKFKAVILNSVSVLNIPEVYEIALQMFINWEKGVPIPPSMRSFVFTSIASSPSFTEGQLKMILKEITHPTALDSREVALASLGHVQVTAFSSVLISYLLKPEIIPIMDSHFIGIPLSTNIHTRDNYLEFFIENYQQFYDLMTTNMVIFDRFVKFTLQSYQTSEKYQQISDLFKHKDIHGFERSVHQVLDNIKINSQWFSRDNEAVKLWLQKQGY